MKTMKTVKKAALALLALLALASCAADDNEVIPVADQLLQQVNGHWYVEVPISGETDNWRSEEEGDVTTYDKIGALIYLNGYYPDACYWGYLYLQDGDMVNYDGLHRNDEEANFAITMDSQGNITPSSHLPNAPVVNNMRYANGVITADVTFEGKSFSLTFNRTELSQEQTLIAFYDILAEEGIVGGSTDMGDAFITDIEESAAQEQARSRQVKQ